MDQFQDGHHVWLRSRVRGTYLHADGDGVGVSLRGGRASLKAAWAVHLHRDFNNVDYVLLHSAAYGRYLGASDARAPLPLCGYRVALQNFDHFEARTIRWQAVRCGSGDDIFLRQARDGYRYLRANGKYLRWINGVSVDDPKYISTMMHWVVEPIPTRQGMPGLPARPIRGRLAGDLSVVMLGLAPASVRLIQYVRAGDDGVYPEAADEGVNPGPGAGWYVYHLRGRSVHRLRDELAMNIEVDASDLIMCVRAGRNGRLTPLVVNLPRHGDTFVIVLIVDGTPASAELRHPDVDAE